ncbi:signal peptidase I [Nesterenkonia alba]|uniref:signal peptidase I n=1 Tax=Nesterenkonia alba TaxID=515814 RepID=UPI001FE163F2|nr:signal peptidase I [Nesterenkonia alba]
MTEETPQAEPVSEPGGSRRLRRLGRGQGIRQRFSLPRLKQWGLWVGAVFTLALVVVIGVRVFAVDVYTVSEHSMEPTLSDGERIAVAKRYPGQEGPQVGDVVVFDGEGSFTPYRGEVGLVERLGDQIGHWFGAGSPPQVFVKRVIGTGGDTVVCCDEAGRLSVNGEPLEEPYLAEPQEAASELSFEAEVPPGRIWVMGDNRAHSVDSRALLGAPGGGMISEDRIIGRAFEVVWPPAERRSIEEGR